MSFEFMTTPRLILKAGGLDDLGTLMAGLGVTRALVVCDPGMVACGFAERARASLVAVDLTAEIFADVQADPPMAVVNRAVDMARGFGADGIVGLGGGSSLDTAKLVALAARTGQPLDDMIGTDKATGRRMPLVQVPTTAGTGSEVTWVSVVTSDNHEKKAIYAPQLLPDIALLDATLTLGMPRHITAATALDAMVHAIEASTSRTRKNMLADTMAEKALTLLAGNFRRVLDVPSDLAAREQMLLGATLAGMAFVNASVGAVHALSYPLGTGFHVPHGHANALVMGRVFRFNMPAAENEYARLATHVLPGRHFISPGQAAAAMIDELEAMFAESGLETRLSKLGVTEAAIPDMAREVVEKISRLIAANPRDMDLDDVQSIYRDAL
ncbi:iron-containing alcohol dehydrogenase [Allorhizobium borbori]|uniref:Alcohol dehydrogenase class IV n=1 Tax=Allorhizobium borbori TaxID=485907 RepID=A0A7W6K509_9HYPH|nr:iron-containing alcohol dehydrogenase [Allorhizobium borbori]MBB4105333.1 alcohol dehydrogenase class IV [Allorhizobium borbori]